MRSNPFPWRPIARFFLRGVPGALAAILAVYGAIWLSYQWGCYQDARALHQIETGKVVAR